MVLGHLKTNPSISVGEAAELLGIDKSNASRLLASLGEEGLLAQTGGDRTYHIGPALIEVTLQQLQRLDLRDVARPHLVALQQQSGETVTLGLWTGNRAICIDRIDSGHQMAIVARIGQDYPLHAGGTGKTLLAFLPDSDRERLLDGLTLTRYTANTVTDRAELLAKLGEIRRKGYCISTEEVDPGVGGIAAPIFDFREVAVGTVSVAFPRVRISPEQVLNLITAVKGTAATVSRALGAPARVLQALDADVLESSR